MRREVPAPPSAVPGTQWVEVTCGVRPAAFRALEELMHGGNVGGRIEVLSLSAGGDEDEGEGAEEEEGEDDEAEEEDDGEEDADNSKPKAEEVKAEEPPAPVENKFAEWGGEEPTGPRCNTCKVSGSPVPHPSSRTRSASRTLHSCGPTARRTSIG